MFSVIEINTATKDRTVIEVFADRDEAWDLAEELQTEVYNRAYHAYVMELGREITRIRTGNSFVTFIGQPDMARPVPQVKSFEQFVDEYLPEYQYTVV